MASPLNVVRRASVLPPAADDDEEDQAPSPVAPLRRPAVSSREIFDFETEPVDARSMVTPAARQAFADPIRRATKAAGVAQREAAIDAEDARRQARAQEKQDAKDEKARQTEELKVTNDAREADFRTRGIAHYTDAHGVIQPVRHPDGSPKFSVGTSGYRTVQEGFDPEHGHYRVRQDDRGRTAVEDRNDYRVFDDEPTVVYRGGPKSAKATKANALDRTGWEKFATLGEAERSDSPELKSTAQSARRRLDVKLATSSLAGAEAERAQASIDLGTWRSKREAGIKRLKDIAVESSALSEVAREKTGGFLGMGKTFTPNAEAARKQIAALQQEERQLRESGLDESVGEETAMQHDPAARALVAKRAQRGAEITAFKRLVKTEGSTAAAEKKFRELLPEDQRENHPILKGLEAERKRLGIDEPAQVGSGDPTERENQLGAMEADADPRVQALAKRIREVDAKVHSVNGTGAVDFASRQKIAADAEADLAKVRADAKELDALRRGEAEAARKVEAQGILEKKLGEAKALSAGRQANQLFESLGSAFDPAQTPEAQIGNLAQGMTRPADLIERARSQMDPVTKALTAIPLKAAQAVLPQLSDFGGDMESVRAIEARTDELVKAGAQPGDARKAAVDERLAQIGQEVGGQEGLEKWQQHAQILDNGTWGISPATGELLVSDAVYSDPKKVEELKDAIRGHAIPGLRTETQVGDALTLVDQRLEHDRTKLIETARHLPGWAEAQAKAGEDATDDEVYKIWKASPGIVETAFNAVRHLAGAGVGLLEQALGAADLWVMDKNNWVAEAAGADWAKWAPEKFGDVLTKVMDPEKSWAGAISGKPNERLRGVLESTADLIGQQLPGYLAAYALAKVPGGKKAAGMAARAQTVLTGTVYGLQNAADNYQRIYDSMVTRDDSGKVIAGEKEAHEAALKAFNASFAVGLTELAPLENVFKAIPASKFQRLVKVLKQSASETAQEILQNKLNNVVTQGHSLADVPAQDMSLSETLTMAGGMAAIVAPGIHMKHRSQAKWLTENAEPVAQVKAAADGILEGWDKYVSEVAPTKGAIELGALDPSDPEVAGAIKAIRDSRTAVEKGRALDEQIEGILGLQQTLAAQKGVLERVVKEAPTSAALNEVAAQVDAIDATQIADRLVAQGMPGAAQYVSPAYVARQKDRIRAIVKTALGRPELLTKAEEAAMGKDASGKASTMEAVYDHEGGKVIEEQARQRLIALVPAAEQVFPSSELDRKKAITEENKRLEAEKKAAKAEPVKPGAKPVESGGKPVNQPAGAKGVSTDGSAAQKGKGEPVSSTVAPTLSDAQQLAADDLTKFLVEQMGVDSVQAAQLATEFVPTHAPLQKYVRRQHFVGVRTRLIGFAEGRGWTIRDKKLVPPALVSKGKPQGAAVETKGDSKPSDTGKEGGKVETKKGAKTTAEKPAKHTAPLPAEHVAKAKVETALAKAYEGAPTWLAGHAKMGTHKFVTEGGEDTGGMWIDSATAQFRINLGVINQQLDQMAPEGHEAWLTRAIDEEIIHQVHLMAARRLWQQLGRPGTLSAWLKDYYGDIWEKEFSPELRAAIEKLREIPGEEPWQKAMEGIRMILQQRRSGTVTEAGRLFVTQIGAKVRAFLQTLLDLIREAAAGNFGGERVKADLAVLEELLGQGKDQTPSGETTQTTEGNESQGEKKPAGESQSPSQKKKLQADLEKEVAKNEAKKKRAAAKAKRDAEKVKAAEKTPTATPEPDKQEEEPAKEPEKPVEDPAAAAAAAEARKQAAIEAFKKALAGGDRGAVLPTSTEEKTDTPAVTTPPANETPEQKRKREAIEKFRKLLPPSGLAAAPVRAKPTPEFLSAAAELAESLAETGVVTPEDFAREMIGAFGEAIGPQTIKQVWSFHPSSNPDEAIAWGKIVEKVTGPTPTAEEAKEKADEVGNVSPQRKAADAIVARIRQNFSPLAQAPPEYRPLDWRELFAITDKAWGGTQAEGKYTVKDAYDSLELAVNFLVSQELGGQPYYTADEDAQAAPYTIRAIETGILAYLPTQTKRTAEQDALQQFSTPPHFAWAANWVANIKPGDVVIEPSAGIGGLGIFAKNQGATVIVNELSPRRREFLSELGFPSIHGENAEHLSAIFEAKIAKGEIPRPNVVVMNPPFSNAAVSGEKGNTMIGAKHVSEALELLAPGGRLVAIVGEGMALDAHHFRGWWTVLGKKYNIRANIHVDGKNYTKYGTSFSNRLLVIDKTGPTPSMDAIVRGEVEKIEELPTLLEGIRNDRGTEKSSGESPGGANAQGGGTTPADGDATGGGADGGVPAGGSGNSEAGSGGKPGGREGESRPGTRSPGNAQSGESRPGKPERGSERAPDDASGRRVEAGGEEGTAPPLVGSEVTLEKREGKREIESEDDIFATYKPAKVQIPGAKPHPANLVESAAMASVEAPDPTYVPNLPQSAIAKGMPSEIQLESVVYAGQAHSKILPNGERRGFFVGDGTGVGKGIEIASILLDNIRQGREKAVWVSKKFPLAVDAKRDAAAVGLNPGSIVSLDKFKAEKDIDLPKGIIFTSYSTLARGHEAISADGELIATQRGGKPGTSRVQQLVKWLGKDFDGVIAFDEAHAAGNAVSIRGSRGMQKPSKTGISVVDLQRALPKARIVYVSATGATELSNLSYADRLGLWGPGTNFSNKNEFFTKVGAGGVSALEIVARDLKSLGGYLARSISYKGVRFDRLTQTLTPEQEAIYDKLATTWQAVFADMQRAMAETGSGNNSGFRSSLMSMFWGSQQRFFNTLLVAMQAPVLLKDMEAKLAEGNSLVLQLVNTNAAQEGRSVDAALAEQEDEDEPSLDDVNVSPLGTLLELVGTHFPTQKYEEVGDPADPEKTIWVPVKDAQGNPVEDPDAVARRNELLAELAPIPVPDSILTQILDKFGWENVAEVTGRPKRLVWVEKHGKRSREWQTRSGKAPDAEAKEFQDLKRRILIFSNAGGTGFSFQSDRTKKNQQQRIHYVVQPGWVANVAIQGLGRSHRSNQANEPYYLLVETNIKGHKRFVSTIARRMGNMGALTTGERRAAGQGLFTEDDNLESEYAKRALTRLVRDIDAGRVSGWNINSFAAEMGFGYDRRNRQGDMEFFNQLLDPKTGKLKIESLPTIPRFLNRILSLPLAKQNALFDEFEERHQGAIEIAKQLGTYDPGTQSFESAHPGLVSMKVVGDTIIYEHPESTAKTRLIELESQHTVTFTSFDDLKWTAGGDVLRFVRNIRSQKIYALKKGPNVTDDKSGDVKESIRRIGVKGGSVLRAPIEFDDPDRYEVIPAAEAKGIWADEIDQSPKTATQTSHFLVGALIPIWDRLQLPSMRIYRFSPENADTMLGVEVMEKDLPALKARLGAGGAMTPKQAFEAVKAGTKLRLANGWSVERVRLSGEHRIEVRGLEYHHRQEFLNYIKGFDEQVNWSTRYFIPMSDEGLGVMERLLAKSPVSHVDGEALGGEGGAPLASAPVGGGKLPAPTPEVLAAATELAESLAGAGVNQVMDFAKEMIDALGDAATPRLLAMVWSFHPSSDPDESYNWTELVREARAEDEETEEDDTPKIKHTDFGEKIGGARKDQWRAKGGLSLDDLASMTPEERAGFVKKDEVWPKPDYAALIEAGMPKAVAAGLKQLRDALAALPVETRYWSREGDSYEEPSLQDKQARYVEILSAFRDGGSKVRTPEDLEELLNSGVKVGPAGGTNQPAIRSNNVNLLGGRRFRRAVFGDFTKEMLEYRLRNLLSKNPNWPGTADWRSKYRVMEYRGKPDGVIWSVYPRGGGAALRSDFQTKEAAEAAAKEFFEGRKTGGTQVSRPLVEDPKREGPDYREGKHATGEDLLQKFGFRGGEFGNWTNDADRQQAVDFAFDSMMDLADVLGVPPAALSLNGQLGIGFGARGRGGRAAAHYEPTRVVINLTRTKGAGSLAHEWAHALDDYFGKMAGTGAGKFMSDTKSRHGLRQEMITAWHGVLDAMTKRTKDKASVLAESEKSLEKVRRNIDGWLASDVRFLETAGKGDEVDEIKTWMRVLKKQIPNSQNKSVDDIVAEIASVASRGGRIIDKHTRKGVTGNALWIERNQRYVDAIENGQTIVGTEKTDFLEAAESMSDYWQRPHELFARAFEAWILDALAKKGRRNDYLVAHAKGDINGSPWEKAYPHGKDLESIGAAFEKFAATLKLYGDATDPEKAQARYPEGLKETALFAAPAFSPESLRGKLIALDRVSPDGTVTREEGLDAFTEYQDNRKTAAWLELLVDCLGRKRGAA